MAHTLSGRVIDAGSGEAVADASVAVVYGPTPAPDIAALTSEDGHFLLAGLSAGHWRIRATRDDGSEASIVVVLPQSVEAEIAVGGGYMTGEE